jgi:hypothetical protein
MGWAGCISAGSGTANVESKMLTVTAADQPCHHTNAPLVPVGDYPDGGLDGPKRHGRARAPAGRRGTESGPVVHSPPASRCAHLSCLLAGCKSPGPGAESSPMRTAVLVDRGIASLAAVLFCFLPDALFLLSARSCGRVSRPMPIVIASLE